MFDRWSAPDHVAVRHGEITVTYGELQRRVHRAVGWLRAEQIQAGDVVALQMPKSVEFLSLHLALLAMGAVTLPLNDRYTPTEVRALVDDARAVMIVAPTKTRAATSVRGFSPTSMPALLARATPFEYWAPVPPDRLGVLCYTSGTTGRAKGACISQGNLEATVSALHEAWRWTDKDVLLHTLPLYHIHGLFVAQHGALYAGATAIWFDGFDAARSLAAIVRFGVTVSMGVPTHYHRFLAHSLDNADLSSVRLFTSGSAPLPATLHRAFSAATGHGIVERYGMTEVGIVLSNPLDGPLKAGTVGVPLPKVEARVVDRVTRMPHPPGQTGELEIRGPSVMAGYLNRPEATAAALCDGWMRTGDLGFVDEDGWVHLVGRTSEMMITGGFNVYPAEVEAVLAEQAGVSEVAVFGLPDVDLGERVCAAIVSMGALDLAKLRTDTKQHLAAYKVPRSYFLVDELPRNVMGKVLKRALTAQFETTAIRWAPEEP